jgi:hypothetical protein
MIYEITLETPQGQAVTDCVDLPLDSELTWQEFCQHREFLHWKKHRESWRVVDITPEDLIRVVAVDLPEEELPEPDFDLPLATVSVETRTIDQAEPEKPKPKFIDGWSGRITKNVEFTRWMAEAVKNGISHLTFKSRVYKLGYDYQRAATQPRGQQGNKQR